MDTKHCGDCGSLNMRNAKFCNECRFEFPDFSMTASKITHAPVKLIKKPSTTIRLVVDTDNEDVEMEEEVVQPDSEFGNCFVDILSQQGFLNAPPRGHKLGDVMGTEKPGTKVRRKAEQKLSAKAILNSTKNRKNQESGD